LAGKKKGRALRSAVCWGGEKRPLLWRKGGDSIAGRSRAGAVRPRKGGKKKKSRSLTTKGRVGFDDRRTEEGKRPVDLGTGRKRGTGEGDSSIRERPLLLPGRERTRQRGVQFSHIFFTDGSERKGEGGVALGAVEEKERAPTAKRSRSVEGKRIIERRNPGRSGRREEGGEGTGSPLLAVQRRKICLHIASRKRPRGKKRGRFCWGGRGRKMCHRLAAMTKGTCPGLKLERGNSGGKKEKGRTTENPAPLDGIRGKRKNFPSRPFSKGEWTLAFFCDGEGGGGKTGRREREHTRPRPLT